MSQEEETVINLLNDKTNLSDAEWDRLCLLLENNDTEGISSSNIFRALTTKHLEEISANSEQIFNAFGNFFCSFVIDNKKMFDFYYCDILGGKLRVFFNKGSIAIQSHALLALLVMGVSNNRWYVERIFWKFICDPKVSDNVIQRFIIDVEVSGINLSRYIKHLSQSIDVKIEELPDAIKNIV